MPGWINVNLKVETRERLDRVRSNLDNTRAVKILSYDALINELINNYEQINKTATKEVKNK